MKKIKPSIHFVDNYLINPTNPISVNVIGAGGTGSQMLTALCRIHQALVQLRHPGLQVTVYDDDLVTPANLGRQLFAETEIGLAKAVALINRINRFFGTNSKAVEEKISEQNMNDSCWLKQLTISCTDNVQSRFLIAKALAGLPSNNNHLSKPMYWMDFGNSRFTGQVILSSIGQIKQPTSKRFNPVDCLPFVTEEYGDLLRNTPENDLPSCSLAEALYKQDLFINSTLANLGASLLWSMLREGMIQFRGFFLNVKTFQIQPIPLCK